MIDSKILRRIEKCLALSESSNPHEAATALRQAQKMMNEHNITEEDIRLSSIEEASTSIQFASARLPDHVCNLMSTIAIAFSVRTCIRSRLVEVQTKTRGVVAKRVQYPVFYGFTSNVEIATYSFEVLYRQLEAERKAYRKTLPSYLPANEKTKLTNAFALGWALNVQNKVAEFAGTPNKEAEELVEKWAEKNLNIKTSRTRARTYNYAQYKAAQEGSSKAEGVSLFHATNGKKQNLLG